MVAMLWLVALPVHGAGDADVPTRCEAIWIAPHERCSMQGTWAATGVGPTQDSARAKALERLKEAVRAGAGAANARLPVMILDSQVCTDVAVTAARTMCFEEPQLMAKRLCYVDLPGSGCGDLPITERFGVLWKVMESGRNRLCSQVSTATRALPLVQQQQCAARCHQEARVRCPSKDVN